MRLFPAPMHMLGLCKENECLLGNLAWHLGRTCFRDTPSLTLHIPRYIGDFTCPRLGNVKSYTQNKNLNFNNGPLQQRIFKKIFNCRFSSPVTRGSEIRCPIRHRSHHFITPLLGFLWGPCPWSQVCKRKSCWEVFLP